MEIKQTLIEAMDLDADVACRLEKGEIPTCLKEQMGPAGMVYQTLIQFARQYGLSHDQAAVLAGYGKGMMLAGYILAQREHELGPWAKALD